MEKNQKNAINPVEAINELLGPKIYPEVLPFEKGKLYMFDFVPSPLGSAVTAIWAPTTIKAINSSSTDRKVDCCIRSGQYLMYLDVYKHEKLGTLYYCFLHTESYVWLHHNIAKNHFRLGLNK